MTYKTDEVPAAVNEAYGQWLRETAHEIRSKRDKLPEESLLRKALSDDVISRFELTEPGEDGPPICCFFLNNTDDAIAELDENIRVVIDPAKVPGWLRPSGKKPSDHTYKCNERSEWLGGVFEVWAKAAPMNQKRNPEFDRKLPNGCDCDICFEIGSRQFYLECTVLTQNIMEQKTWDNFLRARARDANAPAFCISPGPFDPSNAKGPCLYYETRRVYDKVYEKIAKELNPDKCQCADDAPNVLLLSYETFLSGPQFNWAMDILFANDSERARWRPADSSHIADISLHGWLEYTGRRRVLREATRSDSTIEQTCELLDKFYESLPVLWNAPKKLGGIMLFNGCDLVDARVNYHAECRVSHSEMAELERLFRAESDRDS